VETPSVVTRSLSQGRAGWHARMSSRHRSRRLFPLRTKEGSDGPAGAGEIECRPHLAEGCVSAGTVNEWRLSGSDAPIRNDRFFLGAQQQLSLT